LETGDIVLHLVTATRAKGHEYDAVIVLDADDNEWPNHQTMDIEEERRLFHVALSRAKRYLYFVFAGDRIASRFLLEAGLV
jgi:DNA helicase-2/ATP-dependent DNA helicase PcrA